MEEIHHAVVLSDYSETLEVKELPIPVASPGTVVVKVLALYLVNYMNKIYNGSLGYPLHFPMTPGGSCIGRIHKLCPDSTSLKEGQLVITDATITARDNPSVQFLLGIHAGATPEAQSLSGNVWRNGSMAEYVQMPLENVYALDEDALLNGQGYNIIDLPLIQTLMVPYGGLADAGVKVGDTVIVAPSTGNFGGAAVLVALSLGSKVVACGRNQSNLDTLAAEFQEVARGRLRTVAWTGDAQTDTEKLKAAVGNKGADVYIDFSPPAAGADGKTPAHMLQCIAALRNGGTCVLMGGLTGNVELPYLLLMFNNINVRGNFMYERNQALQLIKMVENGNVKLGSHVGHRVKQDFRLDEIDHALDAAASHAGWGTNIALTPWK